MNIDNILAEYFSIQSNRDIATFFSGFSTEQSLKVFISNFLSSIAVNVCFQV